MAHHIAVRRLSIPYSGLFPMNVAERERYIYLFICLKNTYTLNFVMDKKVLGTGWHNVAWGHELAKFVKCTVNSTEHEKSAKRYIHWPVGDIYCHTT